MNTEFFENMVGVFEKQLENGLKGQLLDIIGQIVMGERWAKKSIIKFEAVKKGNEETIKNEKVSGNDTIDSIYLAEHIRSWKEIYPERDYVFPVENIEMTYNIGKTLENHVVRFVGENFYIHVQDIYVLIKDELEKRDEFYREPSKVYSKAYSEYPVIKIFFDETYATALQKMILKIFRPIEQQGKKANQAEKVEV